MGFQLQLWTIYLVTISVYRLWLSGSLNSGKGAEVNPVWTNRKGEQENSIFHGDKRWPFHDPFRQEVGVRNQPLFRGPS
jgi:hypothetical protein